MAVGSAAILEPKEPRMARLFTRNAIVLGAMGCVSGAIAVLAACSSGGGSTPGTGEGGTTTQSCSSNVLSVVFSPAYSAFVTDSTQQTFQVPAVVDGLAAGASVNWSVADPTMAKIDPDPTTGGIMLTMLKPGSTTVIAQVGDVCGQATLDITSATEAQWSAGNARYNNGVPLDYRCIGGGTTTRDGGPCPDAGPACTECHGANSTATIGFSDISHTPEQTGGFSDQDLLGIIVHGQVPDGGYFDPSIISQQSWSQFHQWSDIQGDTQQGMVVYLRSLTPTSQNGTSNFGGHHGDGGFGEGGHHHEGGFGGEGGGGEGGSVVVEAGGSQGDAGAGTD
jgi:hypothetical protein